MNDKIKINYIIPMGINCVNAYFLKEQRLKTCSYVFDWTLLEDIEAVIMSVKDDFKEILDRREYIPCPKLFKGRDVKRCGHSSLPNCEQLFFHNDPRTDEGYAYLNRCVDRFRKVLKKREPKLFTVFSFGGPKNPRPLGDQIIKLNEVLSKITENYYIMSMNHQYTKPGEYPRRGIPYNIEWNENIVNIDVFPRKGLNKKGNRHQRNDDRRRQFTPVYETFEFDIKDDIK